MTKEELFSIKNSILRDLRSSDVPQCTCPLIQYYSCSNELVKDYENFLKNQIVGFDPKGSIYCYILDKKNERFNKKGSIGIISPSRIASRIRKFLIERFFNMKIKELE